MYYPPNERICMCANNNPNQGGYIGTGSACPCEDGYHELKSSDFVGEENFDLSFDGFNNQMVERYKKPIWTVG